MTPKANYKGKETVSIEKFLKLLTSEGDVEMEDINIDAEELELRL